MELLQYRKSLPRLVWPKNPPVLSEEQLQAREKFMMLWHQELPLKYGIIEKFNNGFVANLPFKQYSKTLEIGAGIGEHLKYEDLTQQEYYCLEYREEFCKEIQKFLPTGRVLCGDIQDRQSWETGTFDRIIAIHVLEHLRNLPKALDEIQRLLKPDGYLDIVIPCEAGLAHTFARKISAERLFQKNFKMSFAPIHLNEHVNSFSEITEVLAKRFKIVKRDFFPLKMPIANINLCVGFRLKKRY